MYSIVFIGRRSTAGKDVDNPRSAIASFINVHSSFIVGKYLSVMLKATAKPLGICILYRDAIKRLTCVVAIKKFPSIRQGMSFLMYTENT